MSNSKTYPVLPLRGIVVFPHMVAPLFVGREKSVRALEEVMRNDKQLILAAQRDATTMIPLLTEFMRSAQSQRSCRC